ncbi:hypothetical protein ACQR16_01495 [Bradyrhizobium oligotrophicum]|uniref:hypothetical protein n=1 Tax=Bradyrhizobium oligotrophicum TaxID=44255 RepID=UPI003EBFE6A2
MALTSIRALRAVLRHVRKRRANSSPQRELQQFHRRSIAMRAWATSQISARATMRPAIWNSGVTDPLLAQARSMTMPHQAAESQDCRRPPAPIRSSTTPPLDQIKPPLNVDGLEAVRDPNC